MIIRVDAASPTPVYEQIREQIARMVSSGSLPPGARLPSIRQLAGDLGVAKGTVVHAYDALLRDGMIRAAGGRRGTVVAEHPPATGEPSEALRAAARGYALTARQLGTTRGLALEAVHAALDEFDGDRG